MYSSFRKVRLIFVSLSQVHPSSLLRVMSLVVVAYHHLPLLRCRSPEGREAVPVCSSVGVRVFVTFECEHSSVDIQSDFLMI